MFKILIADDNISFAKLLVNDIISTRENLRVVKIATDGKETLELMNTEQLDIVLLDLKMPIYNGLQILDMLSEEKKKQYNRSVIVITGEPDYAEQLVNNPMVSYIIFKGSCQKKNILERIDQLVEEKFNYIIYNKISLELYNLGYNPTHKGTKYLTDTILEIYLHLDSYQGNLKKEIYPIISLHFNQSIHNIKCNITRATENMTYYCKQEVLNKYFNGFKPTPKDIIDIILNKIA